MARPRKIYEDVEGDLQMEEEPKVKQLIRYLSNITQADQQTAIQDVDKQLSEYIDKGYKLFNTHFLGRTNEGTYMVLYILTKE